MNTHLNFHTLYKKFNKKLNHHKLFNILNFLNDQGQNYSKQISSTRADENTFFLIGRKH